MALSKADKATIAEMIGESMKETLTALTAKAPKAPSPRKGADLSQPGKAPIWEAVVEDRHGHANLVVYKTTFAQDGTSKGKRQVGAHRVDTWKDMLPHVTKALKGL